MIGDESTPSTDYVILGTMIFDDEIRYFAGDMWVAVKRDRRGPPLRDFRAKPFVVVETD